KYKFIINGDALYAVEPIIEICEKNRWNYIFNLKPDRLKEINSTFEGNIQCFNEVKYKNYYLSTNIKYKNHILSAFKYIESKKNKTTIFRYISNMDINDNSIKEIVSLGR